MTPTPRTDACTKLADSDSAQEDSTAYWKLCGQLERELAAMTAERDALMARARELQWELDKRNAPTIEGWSKIEPT